MKETRKPSNNTAHDTHGMSIESESIVEVEDLLVYEHLIVDAAVELLKFLWRGLSSIQQDETHLCERAFFNQVFDGITTVVQVSISCSVSNGRLAAASDGVTRIIAEHFALSIEGLDVNHFSSVGAYKFRLDFARQIYLPFRMGNLNSLPSCNNVQCWLLSGISCLALVLFCCSRMLCASCTRSFSSFCTKFLILRWLCIPSAGV